MHHLTYSKAQTGASTDRASEASGEMRSRAHSHKVNKVKQQVFLSCRARRGTVGVDV